MFLADWDQFGKSAGYKRNIQMAEHADALIAIWDGKSKGTMHMITEACKRNLRVHLEIHTESDKLSDADKEKAITFMEKRDNRTMKIYDRQCKINLYEVSGDLFSCDKSFCLVHCISADLGMAAGIAVRFNKEYDMKNKILASGKTYTGISCIAIDNVLNLITKRKYYDKPTYESLQEALEIMRDKYILPESIDKVASPLIGCGLDGLNWKRVSAIIKEVFFNVDLEWKVYVYRGTNGFIN